jgi:hypothetical protein
MKFGMPLAYRMLRLLRRTWRARRITEHHASIRPCLYAIYHGDMMAIATEFPFALPGVDVLSSHSRDGDLIARFVTSAGAGSIRGGSSKGQMEALRAMRESIEKGHAVVVAVDGPRGPYGIVKSGIVMVASQTGAPILPSGIAAGKAWRFSSWDRAYIPKPGSPVVFEYGAPIHVPPDADRDTVEQYRLLLENRMREMRDHIGAGLA